MPLSILIAIALEVLKLGRRLFLVLAAFCGFVYFLSIGQPIQALTALVGGVGLHLHLSGLPYKP